MPPFLSFLALNAYPTVQPSESTSVQVISASEIQHSCYPAPVEMLVEMQHRQHLSPTCCYLLMLSFFDRLKPRQVRCEPQRQSMLRVTSLPHTFPAAPLSSLTLIWTDEQSSHPLDCPVCVTQTLTLVFWQKRKNSGQKTTPTNFIIKTAGIPGLDVL